MRLKEQLKHLLKQNNMNPTQLSRKANVPRQTVGNWLSGQAPKNLDQVKRVADLFYVTLDHMLYGEEPTQSLMDELISKRYEIRIIREIKPMEGKI